jgi:hypothetical protein
VLLLSGVLFLFIGFTAFPDSSSDTASISVVFVSLGASLLATALYVFLTAVFARDEIIKAEQILNNEILNLQLAIVDVCSVVSSNSVSKVVTSNAEHSIDFSEKFVKAKKIDLACHTGGTVINNNIEALGTALRNGANIRVLFNNEKYEFFNPNNELYENLQNSLCPDRASRIYTNQSIDMLRKIAKNIDKDSNTIGAIEAFYSDGLITGQVVIIDDSEAFYTPYLPGNEIYESFRVEFSLSASDHIRKLKKSFDTTWNTMNRKIKDGGLVNRIQIM